MPRARLFTLLFPLLAAAAACASADSIAGPAAATSLIGIAAPPIAQVEADPQLAIMAAAEGLLYTSESDYPFTYFTHAMPRGSASVAPTVAQLRAMLAIPASTPVEIITLDKFFERHIERADPADAVAQALIPRYVALRETLRASLYEVQVYRVGTIAIECYVVGLDENGDLAGLTTISIET